MAKNQYRVLIADDDEGYRFPLASILNDFNYIVLEAEDVEGVKKQAKDAQIWVVDVRLPSEKNEGIEVVRKLITDGECTPNFNIIFISVLTEEECKPQLENFPMDYRWIEKPFEPEYLLNIIEEMTGSSS